jgi:hypothetical protein
MELDGSADLDVDQDTVRDNMYKSVAFKYILLVS